MANEVEVYEQTPMSGQQMRAQVAIIQDVMKSVMQKDVHFGNIPGTEKPTLLKAGAEKLMMTFHLSPSLIVDDMSSADENRYRVRVTITGPTGRVLGTGIGEASSDEEKYKWRKIVCEEEFRDTQEDRKRVKWYRGNPAYQVKQIRTNIADVANTILKMAKKRALVDAVLTVTAASDIFTQDVEDMPEELIGDKKGMTPKAAEPANGAVIIKSVADRAGKGPYKVTDTTGVVYSTFDDKIAEYAKKSVSMGLAVMIVSEKDKFGYKIVEIKSVPPATAKTTEREPGQEG